MVVTSLISLCFHTFSLVFSKKTLFTNLRKSLSKSSYAFSSSVFMSIYSFKLTFWLNFMTLCTFINNYPWLNACFKFRKCITHSSLSWKFATSFSIFSNFHSFRQKRVNHLEVYVNFQDIEYQLQEKISFVTIIVITFYEIFINFSGFLRPLKITWR